MMRILLLLSLATTSNGFTVDLFVDSLIAVKQHFRSGCVYMLHNQENDMLRYRNSIIVMKKLYDSEVSFAVLFTSMFPDSLDELSCVRNTRLIILPPSLQQQRQFLSQMSFKLHMSDAIWLLFLEMEISLYEFFAEINIPFDCEFLVAQLKEDNFVVITEVYRIRPTFSLQVYEYGSWTPSDGLVWPTAGFYKRRNDLQGISLKTGTLESSVTRFPERDKWKIESDFFTKIWLILEEEMNFTTEYHIPNDDLTGGGGLSNGSWTGVFGMLQRREIEVSNLPFTMTSVRMDIIDFTTPLTEIRTYLIIKKPNSYELKWDEFLLPFSAAAWFGVYLVILLLIISIIAACLVRRYACNVEDLEYDFPKAVFIVVSAFCQQGYSGTPKTSSLRFIFVTSYLTAMVLLACYSAAFITHLTLRDPALPFQNFKEFLEDGSYQLGMMSKSAQMDYFKNSTVKVLMDIYRNTIAPHESSLHPTDKEGLQQLCHLKKYAHMASTYSLNLPGYLPNCSISLIPQAFYPGTLAIVTAKRSPYLGLLNFKLQEMRHDGIQKDLYRKYSSKMRIIAEERKLSVDLYDAVPILMVLAIGMLISIVIFVLEFVIVK